MSKSSSGSAKPQNADLESRWLRDVEALAESDALLHPENLRQAEAIGNIAVAYRTLRPQPVRGPRPLFAFAAVAVFVGVLIVARWPEPEFFLSARLSGFSFTTAQREYVTGVIEAEDLVLHGLTIQNAYSESADLQLADRLKAWRRSRNVVIRGAESHDQQEDGYGLVPADAAQQRERLMDLKVIDLLNGLQHIFKGRAETPPSPSVFLEPLLIPGNTEVSLRADPSHDGQRLTLSLRYPESAPNDLSVRLTVPAGGQITVAGSPFVPASAAYLELKPVGDVRLEIGIRASRLEIRRRIRVNSMSFERTDTEADAAPRRISAIESGSLSFSSMEKRSHTLGPHALVTTELREQTSGATSPGEVLSLVLDGGFLEIRVVGEARRILVGGRDIRPRVLAVWSASSEWTLFLAAATSLFSFVMSYRWFRR